MRMVRKSNTGCQSAPCERSVYLRNGEVTSVTRSFGYDQIGRDSSRHVKAAILEPTLDPYRLVAPSLERGGYSASRWASFRIPTFSPTALLPPHNRTSSKSRL